MLSFRWVKMATPTRPDRPEYTDTEIELFCLEYLRDFNATRAIKTVRSELKPASARVTASCLINRPDVAKRLAEMAAQKVKSLDIDIDAALISTFKQAMLNPFDYMELDKEGKPSLNLKACKENPDIARLLNITFGVSVTKTGKKVHTYTVSPYSRDAAMDRLFKLQGLMAGGDEETNKGASITLNVNFPVPASGWRTQPKTIEGQFDAEDAGSD